MAKPRLVFIRPVDVGLWLAQGFGVGRIPVAPGTFGSIVGVAFFSGLLVARSTWVLAAGIIAGVALSVWLCGLGERALGAKDPGSVVLDEIAAMPVCYLGWVVAFWSRTGALPTAGEFFAGSNWPVVLGGFLAFRLFDIWKPWPVRQSQVLPGGWGITLDDLLAALYVNAALLLGNALAYAIVPKRL